MHILVGNHLMETSSNSPMVNEFINLNFNRFLNSINKTPDIHLTIEDGYGSPFVNYHVKITKENGKLLYQRADYLIETDLDYKNAKIFVHNELALKHALMNFYSSYIVHHHWGILIHSSCALENNTAHIFSGHSGAGKSTAAKLSHPRELLSDEATLVKITDDDIKIFNSPFRSEISTTNADQTAQLGSIQILHQALVNKRVELGKADAILHLMDKVFYWVHSPEETKIIMKLLMLLVKKVPVYQLHFKKDPTFWELIS
ncbi:hypothetical protein [Bacillus sp. T3]|uniref:hypothetical protein n=1 Tax=Bacillus sp. T3 TaxID=467262 RepID=UPI002981B4A1|nr:hypothetical protein [Bacillus sp. T3]